MFRVVLSDGHLLAETPDPIEALLIGAHMAISHHDISQCACTVQIETHHEGQFSPTIVITYADALIMAETY